MGVPRSRTRLSNLELKGVTNLVSLGVNGQ